MKTLGIIGGLGPMASAYLLQLIIEMTDAKTDQEHLDVILFDRPQVPDRTAHILDPAKPSPLPSMRDTAQTLERLGAGVICAPCVTSHCFYPELAASVSVPFLHMVEEAGRELLAAGKKSGGHSGHHRHGAHPGCSRTPLPGWGWRPWSPTRRARAMSCPSSTRTSRQAGPRTRRNSRPCRRSSSPRAATALYWAAPSSPSSKKATPLGHGYLDALEVLAKRCVQACGGPLKDACQNLIT